MDKTGSTNSERLHAFFRPRSIALVGATDKSRWSVYTYENLKNFDFAGPIYLVNPNREIVHGEHAIKSLKALQAPVDLAYIMVSTPHVLSVIKEAAEVGIKHFVVLTSGFGESGAEGVQLERDLLMLVQERDLVVLGPNGNGFLNIANRIAPFGLPVSPATLAGPVAVVLQSGALASVMLAFAQAHAIGLSTVVSMGNESMLSVTDVVDYLLDDDATQVIALFLESIRHPKELRYVADKARMRRKPIVVFKVGRSEASSRTALAHTGALVGNDAVNDAAFRQLGILRVHSLEDLLTTAGLASFLGLLPGRRMGVVTPSGGACDILSDLAQDEGIMLPDFAQETVEQLRAILPPFSTPHNPLDVTGYIVVDGTLQRRALNVVVHDPGIDFVLNLVSITEATREPTAPALAILLEQYELLMTTIRAAPLPVVNLSNTCSDLSLAGRSLVKSTGLHVVAGMEHGMRALGRLLWWSELMRTSSREALLHVQEEPQPQLPLAQLNDVPLVGNWSEAQARILLQKAAIPVVPGILATTAEEAAQAAHTLGLPVALKIQSATVFHKSDIGGVALNLTTEAAVRDEFTTMLKRVQVASPDAEIEGILVSAMRPEGIELLVGIVRDPLWGLVLTVGLGGIWAEALKDTALRVLPVRREEIGTMLGELRGAALLYGGRGRPPVDLDALIEVISRISTLAQTLEPHLNVLEINPLWIRGASIEALDVLVSWQE